MISFQVVEKSSHNLIFIAYLSSVRGLLVVPPVPMGKNRSLFDLQVCLYFYDERKDVYVL